MKKLAILNQHCYRIVSENKKTLVLNEGIKIWTNEGDLEGKVLDSYIEIRAVLNYSIIDILRIVNKETFIFTSDGRNNTEFISNLIFI